MHAEQRIAELEARLAERDETVAAGSVRIAALEQQVEALIKQAQKLRDELGQNSSNSDRPPSSDSPKARGTRNKGKGGKNKEGSGRPRGGQKGHKGSRRELLPESQVQHMEDHYPSHCANCHDALPKTPDPHPKRYQVTEVPPVEPETTEHRRHAVNCDSCGHRTRAVYDPDRIPRSPFGPRLMALIALLTGVYHLSRRRSSNLLSEMVGVRVSLGAISSIEARVSDAVATSVDEAWEQVWNAGVKHTDGTGWLQGGAHRSLWTLATAACTVFKIVANSSKETLKPLYSICRGILISDRAKALNFWVMERRQVCWAHLLRKFISFSEKDGKAGELGLELLDYTGVLFQYWHDFKDGKLTREQFHIWMAPVQMHVEAVLKRAQDLDISGVSGSCRDILEHKAALWNFVEHLGLVEPTNNHAEQQLRAFVLWRKRSFGTQSDRGNRFAERIMTVAHTARKQGLDVLDFLTASCKAQLAGETAPSLLTAA